MITPTTPATFYGFKDQLITMPLIQLSAYVIALKTIVKHGHDVTGQNVEKKVRALLKTPKGYPVEDILHHLQTVKLETEQYYGIKQS